MQQSIPSMTTGELLSSWSAIMDELKSRDAIRTNNNPVGDIAEMIAHAHYGGTRGSFSQKGWDVLTDTGQRVQVKGVRMADGTKRSNLSSIRGEDYDIVSVVVLGHNFRLRSALEIPRTVVEDLFPVRSYVNGRIIQLGARLTSHPLVRDVDMSTAYKAVME